MKKGILNSSVRSIISVILLVSGLTARSQNETHTSAHSLYAGTGFTSNMVYMGTSISQDRPAFTASLMYSFKDKLYLSASTCHLSAFDPFLALHTFTLGYNQTINSWFDISADISRYQIAPSLTDTLFKNFVYGNLSMGFDWKILYTKLSVGGILSEESATYIQVKNSRYFQTPAFVDGKVYISFDPCINMLFGTLTSTKTTEGATIGISQPFHSQKSGVNSTQNTTTFFGLTELDMCIPVSLNTDRFTLEAEPGYVYTLYSDTEILNPKGFIFMVNCNIKIY